MKMRQQHRSAGFTLIELLVVIAIIAVLALLGFMTARKMIDRGKKVQTLAQFRDINSGLTMFVTDYQKPPLPPTKVGIDTIYGDPNGTYNNAFIVAVLAGNGSVDYPSSTGENFKVSEVNKNMTSYLIFPSKPDKKSGVGADGRLYDPWGGEVIIAINGGRVPGKEDGYADDLGSPEGTNDRRLWIYDLKYKDSEPKDQDFVLWSFGPDKIKGTRTSNPGGSKVAKVPYTGSDDVISW